MGRWLDKLFIILLMGLFPDPPPFAPKVVFVHLMHVAHLCIICTLFRLEVNRLYPLYLLWPTLYHLFVVVCFGARIFLFIFLLYLKFPISIELIN
jgi:hypothetical protein